MRTVTIAAGDTNLKFDQRTALAAAAGATLVEGHGVDCAFVIGARVITTHVLPMGGSDHPPVVYVLGAGWRIVVLEWNVLVTQRPRRVRRRLQRLIKTWNPDVIMLSEAYHCRDQLARIKGYHLIQGENVGEGADCALLVRLTNHLERSGTARMRQRWTGPKHGLAKEPRHYPHGAFQIQGDLAADVEVRALALHLPTPDRAGHNTPAVDESVDYATHWITKGRHH